jgi:hypothetical protein
MTGGSDPNIAQFGVSDKLEAAAVHEPTVGVGGNGEILRPQGTRS